MTNGEILRRYRELEKVSGCTGTLGWYVYKNMKVLKDAVEPYVQAHNDLIKKYGGSGSEEVPKENKPAFATEELMLLGIEQDVELAKMKRIQFEQLVRADKSMTAETMLILDENIVED